MRDQLRQIYADLASGKLSRDEALARIRTIKLQEHGPAAGPLLIAPAWVEGAEPSGSPGQYAEHHVLLCGQSAGDAETLRFLLPKSRCVSIQVEQGQDLAARYSDSAVACFEHLQSILQARPQGDVLVQVVVPGDGEQVLLAGLSGLLRTAELENPRIAGQLLLVAGELTAEELARSLEGETRRGREPLVKYEDGRRLVWRWQELEAGGGEPPVAFRDGGVYLITGGRGGVGRLFAEEIRRQAPGARVVLAGRSAENDRQADVTDRDQVARLTSSIYEEHGRLDGILHCAGILADEFLLKKSAGELRRVLAPKVAGAVYLDEATRGLELDFFVLFSSFAGAMGNPGQCDYAAANAFLDHFAAYRNRLVAAGERRGRTRSIDWPLWQEGGMVMNDATRDALREATGIEPMQTATGLAAFHRCLALPHDQLLVAEGDLARLRHSLLTGRPIQPDVPAAAAAAPRPAADDLHERTQDFLRAELAELLKLPPRKIDPRAALERYGMDSILAMKLTAQLEKTFGTLSKTLFFEYQTLHELAQYFVESHAARLSSLFAEPEPALPAAEPEPKRAGGRRFARPRHDAKSEPEPIAIVGLSGRYPEAVDLDAYWRNLRDGKDCIVEIPKERWDWRAWFSGDRTEGGRHYSKWGGFISGVDKFDPLFFNISPKDAKYIDPQERLFLQHAWMALEDAGYTRAALQLPQEDDLPGQVGVYAGVMYSEYQLVGAESTLKGKPVGVANSTASIANRVSYALNLHGPSMTVDTMCSSSLTAIHLACQDLRLGRTNLALAGGVNVTIHPNKYLVLSTGQFISSDGHCQSFGEGGDGYIPGEGVGVVVLKRLSDAERDGDHIYALIRGSALNHGGKTNGYTVPNPQAQAAAIGRALAEARVDARHISYLEAHGTGTKLGDPIEIAALGKAFGRYTQDRQFCLLGSAKSNIGHCESAAGIAGLTKVLLQMQHRQIVPSLHSATLNPHIDFASTPFVVNQSLRPWERPVVDGRTLPRIAGISSFGAGGSNAHLIVEEYVAPEARRTAAGPVAIVLSARTAGQLQQKAADLLQFVRAHGDALDLESLAWTLQAGREAMDERLGFVAASVDALAAKLEHFLSGRLDGVARDDVKRHRESLGDETADTRDLEQLLALWVKGVDVDWGRLYGDPKPRRMSLPVYPFAKERYWIDVPPAAAQATASNLSPAQAAYLEMARAAVAEAAGTTSVELRDVAWAEPVTIPVDTPVQVTLLPDGERIDFEIHSGEVVHCQGRAFPNRDEAGIFSLDLADAQALERLRQEPSLRVLLVRGFAPGAEAALASFPYPTIAVLREDAVDASFTAAALCDFMVCGEESRYGYTAPAAHDLALLSERFGALLAQELLFHSGPATGRDLRAKGWTGPIVPAAQVETHARQLASALAAKSPDALRLLKQHLTRALAVTPAAAPATEDEASTPPAIAPAEHIRIATPAERVLALTFGIADAKDIVAELSRIFGELRGDTYYKAVILASDDPELLFALPDGVAREAQRLIADAKIPVVAALARNAKGNAFLVAQSCDACVYSRGGVYSAANIRPVLAQQAVALLSHRLGDAAAAELLLTGGERSGSELRERVPALRVAERDRVFAAALELAAHWATLPRTTLARWKGETAAALHERTRSLPDALWERTEDAPAAATAPVAIPLQSRVVTLTAHPDGVAVLQMEDREAKNMFSDAFRNGVAEAFAHIAATPRYKAVVLTGFDSYFASGGTKESLLAIQQGRAKFTDYDVHQLALDCRLPVVAAIQGHAIGAGWPMGMLADLVVLSEESHYLSPYMGYGFTPGAGATWVLPEKLGRDLARESLFTAQPATGRELRERGLAVRVLPRAEVPAAALQLAREMARSPRARLLALKEQLTAGVREALQETYRLELAMHEQTFVGRADTLERIERTFHQEQAAPVLLPIAAKTDDGETLRAVSATLRTLLANELQLREGDVDEHAQFVDLGLDSISGVTWVRKINEKYGTSIEATSVYSYPTLAQLSRFVKEEAEKQGTLSPPPAAEPAPRTPAVTALPPVTTRTLSSWRKDASARPAPARRTDDAIAIVGIAGQFPQAKNVDDFWQNIAQGKNCITKVPAERWDTGAWYQPGDSVPGKTYSQWVGALEDYDRFDPLFFNISPRDAESMDPQQRLFLQACWHAIEHAGYDTRALSGTKCGVFAGCAYGDYHLLSRDQQLSGAGFTGDATSILAGRVSYALNLQGPCLSIDTACSSSLVAIAHACDSLVSGASDLALAGGVYVMAGPEMHVKTAQVGMLSPDGRCFTFDQRANGIVPGEAVGAVLLKRLADAERDGDTIHAVIHGWGVNQDGKTNGITAPNTESQARLEQDVYERFRIDPANIQLIEAHGTGTKLGDPIEINALKKAFARYTRNEQYCAIGSVKSNIGHCLTAAGIAGVAKLVMALRHRQLPPTINFERLNEHISLDGSPFYVNTRLQEWPAGPAQRRLAAISSFGFSGTNAHLVLGEYVPSPAARPSVFVLTQDGKVVVPLSARTAAQLKEKAADLLSFLRRQKQSLDLHELAYTLQVGREPMDERLGIMAGSLDELARKLEAWIDGRSDAADVYQASVKRSRESIAVIAQDDEMREVVVEKCLSGRKLSRLLELWVKGLEVDWHRLYGETRPRRIPLPLYPFAKERYWIDVKPVAAAPSAIAAPVLHPLLHSNASDLGGQRYRSLLAPEELSAAACLEMVRAAVVHASPERPEGAVVELRDVAWPEPLTAKGEVTIALAENDEGEIEFEISSGSGTVHCQGRAVLTEQPAPPAAAHDLIALKRVETAGELALHPSMLEAALDAAGVRAPLALATLRVFAPCGPEMSVRVRTAGDTIDLELCDRRGNVAAQLQGLEATRKEVAAPRPVVAAAPLPAPAPAERKKPAISLAAPGAAVGTAAARPRPSITLAAPAAPAVSSVQLHDEGNGVFAVDLAHAGDVRQALERARQESSLKVLLLHGLERGCDPALYQPLVSFPYPTVAVLERDAAGTGFLAAALCDFMVCSEEASYAFAHPTPAVARLFTERFGAALAQRFLAGGAAMTGRELREQGCACPCAPRHEVRAQARAIASTLATKSRDAIRILKGHLARHIAALAGELAVPEAAAQAAGPVEVIRFRDAAELIARLQQPADAGALVLAGDDWTFADDAVAELQRLLLDSEVPVVAALAGDVKGNGWLAAQLCDAAVYDRNGVYSAAGIGPLQTAAAAFLHRFGSAAAGELLLTGAESSGAALLRRLGTLTVADCDDVVAAATRAAESWARLPRATVAAWKQQLRDAIRNMPAPLHDGELPELPPDVPTKIALRSTAVTATAHPEGILVVAMEDREAKNMFSDAFVEGVAEAFAHAARTPAYKVVVLTGFDSYFASGGTKEGLVAIQQGKVKFTDVDVHQMALDCRLPVVAAMQGHGIGAGWCLGLFADVVLLSEESRYVSPYMEYGFTPGAGATFILADRIGQDLARESLLTARQLAGSELKARGLRLPILPRAEVVEAAMEIARQIARGPRGRLLALKQLLAAHVRRELPETYRRELAMHEQTFVGQSDTLAQIQSKFAPELEKPQVAAPVAEAAGHGDVLRAVTVSLRALLARELHLRESDVEDDAEFVSLGLDSISAVTFVRAINERYKTSIEATKIYRFPTLAQLAAFVKEEAERHGTLPAVAVAAPPPVVADVPAQPKIAIKPGASRLTSGRRVRRTEKPAAAPAPEPAQAREAIAVVGMSGRFPQARNLDEYWRNLEAGRNSITEVPPDRWDVRQYDRARWLGVLDDVDRFDPLFFRIAPQEAEYMDPQHRLFLQESYRAFEDAGYAGRDLSDKKCGVYLGMSINDYAMLLLKRGIRTTPVTANSFAVAAARIAYYLNLKGPAITVDTACSSSLVAIHLACQSLLSGETDMALAGGVTLWLTPESHLSMSEAGMLSADGQCKAFDDSADGIVVSEGVGALVLKRLKDAEADGDVIHGVILGSGINQDGRTNGITAPSVNSQIELERSIYAKFGIDPATISYVEAHGTGTKLGDPIELEALAAAFREKTDRKNYCAIGSVKSNIGHTASAAGVASVLKVLLSLRHRTLVPTLHVTKENSHFDFASSPFYVCREKQAWEPVGGARRRAAVSSFGYSGTNSHLVLEEYVPSADGQTAANGPVIVPLSARTAEQLQQKARELAERLRGTPDLDLQSVAYTLQVGRDAMDERAAFLAGSVEELAGKLTAFAEGGKGIEHAWQGRVEAAGDSMALIGRDDDIQEAVDKWIARGKLAKLAELWSRGLNFDWQKLWGAARPRRASLPTYPFARDRYWIDKVTASAPPAENPFANIVGMDSLSSDSIEEILGRIDGGALETERAVRLLRMLV